MNRFKFKNDKYRKSRGGSSRLLDLSCTKCGNHLFFYQKDGPGMLRRLYLDRIFEGPQENSKLTCPNCKELLGVLYIFEKEKRPAYRLFKSTLSKKIIMSK